MEGYREGKEQEDRWVVAGRGRNGRKDEGGCWEGQERKEKCGVAG
jgi:hypothetical protein